MVFYAALCASMQSLWHGRGILPSSAQLLKLCCQRRLACREHLGQHPCDKRRPTHELAQSFPAVDFSLVCAMLCCDGRMLRIGVATQHGDASPAPALPLLLHCRCRVAPA